MKVIVTGVTGYIGSAVLARCVKDPRITSIIALSRKPLPLYEDEPRVDVRIVQDFGNFDDETIASWKGAEACLWCLGLALPPTPEIANLLAFTFPKAFLDTFASVSSESEQRSLKFVLLSGALVEKDQSKRLWFLDQARKVRGRTEVQVLTDTFSNPLIPSIVVRPGGVFDSPPALFILDKLGPVISRSLLAASIVSVGVEGVSPDESAPYQGRAVENATLVKLGKTALERYGNKN